MPTFFGTLRACSVTADEKKNHSIPICSRQIRKRLPGHYHACAGSAKILCSMLRKSRRVR